MIEDNTIQRRVWEMYGMLRNPHPERESWNKAYQSLALELSSYWVKKFLQGAQNANSQQTTASKNDAAARIEEYEYNPTESQLNPGESTADDERPF